MTSYTFTAEQSAAAIAKWNDLANTDNQLSLDQVHLILGDNFDSDIEDNGCSQIEVGTFASKTGNPATFYIFEEDVTVDA
ncbi:MAG: hypothetical protein AAF755_13115 [Pseudomonadota bacterium]